MTTPSTPDTRETSSEPGAIPVPSPVERRIVTVVSEGQEISDEQRQRVVRWLEANGIHAKRVAQGPVTIESQVRGDRETRHLIRFDEYCEDESGRRVYDDKTLRSVKYTRWVTQEVPLEPDPSWQGWASQYEQWERQKKQGSAA